MGRGRSLTDVLKVLGPGLAVAAMGVGANLLLVLALLLFGYLFLSEVVDAL